MLWSYVLRIAKAGRSVGIHLISCVQRSTATNLPPDLKSQVARISFRQKSIIDSINIINTDQARKLKERECIVNAKSDTTLVKVPWVDEDYILLNKYVPEINISGQNPIEVTNIVKEDDQILMIEAPTIIDVPEKDIKPVQEKRKRKGVISLEEIKNANRER